MIPVASQQIIEEQENLENSMRIDVNESKQKGSRLSNQKGSRFTLPKL